MGTKRSPQTTRNPRGMIGVHRPRASGPFDVSAKHKLQLFLPHLQRALQMRQRLSASLTGQHASNEALARTYTATFVVAGYRRILYANPAAETLFHSGDGIQHASRAACDQSSRHQRAPGCIDPPRGRHRDGFRGSSGGALVIERGERLPLTFLSPCSGRRGRVWSCCASGDRFHSRPRKADADDLGVASAVRSDPGGGGHRQHAGRW